MLKEPHEYWLPFRRLIATNLFSLTERVKSIVTRVTYLMHREQELRSNFIELDARLEKIEKQIDILGHEGRFEPRPKRSM